VVITEGRRLLFVIPWGERVILGTTDTDYRGAPEDVAIEAADVTYVLGIVNEFFPRAALGEADLVGGWAGLRPLIANPDGSPSDVSRAHQITTPETGWWDIAGGKLTTYRLMAEQAVDQIARHLGGPVPASRTAQETLLLPAEMTPYSGIAPAPFTRAAVEHYVRHEWARHLEDVLHRRSGWHFHDRLTPAAIARVAGWMAAELQWSPDRVLCEIGTQGSGRLFAPAA
jgi:glycerol-3-phosphate dehydrogenase